MDKKFKIFVVIGMIALAVLAATGTVLAVTAVNGSQVEQGGNEEKDKKLMTFSLTDPITANLASESKKSNMMIVSVGLGVDTKSKEYKEFSKNFSANEVMIRDEIISIIRKQTYEAVTKSDAQEQLAKQIKESVNQILGTTLIEEIYFGEFFVK